MALRMEGDENTDMSVRFMNAYHNEIVFLDGMIQRTSLMH